MTKPSTHRVLIIAGSDSSGGAGIQADIKTCAAFGTYSATAITAVTAQNTMGVQQVEIMPAALVRAQIRSVLSDIGADVIKIGMLGNAEIIDVVAEEIEESDAFVILDPVMVATSGDTLLADKAIDALKTKLLSLADLVTPNVPEAELLTGLKITDVDDLTKAGDALLKMNVYAAPRHTHGTGCTLASAVAACMAQGAPLEEAVITARDYVFHAIKTAPGLGAPPFAR